MIERNEYLEELKDLRDELTDFYEFKNHEIPDSNIYRLYFVEYMKSEYTKGLHVTNWPSKLFTLPKVMTREEVFRVISYLTDEDDKKCTPGTLNEANTLNGVIFLERFGFKQVKEKDESKIIDLFTISGRINNFKRYSLYYKYFEWYKENISREEVVNIYSKLGKEFKDIVWLDKENVKTKTLEK